MVDLSDFSSVDFPAMNHEAKEFVYVLCWTDGSRFFPFYVGQTTRFWGRMDDYYWAAFAACTDFRVGHAVRYLNTKGRVVIKYKACIDSRTLEAELIKSIGKPNLLNGLRAFDYRTADKDEEHKKILDFLDSLLSKPC